MSSAWGASFGTHKGTPPGLGSGGVAAVTVR